MAGHLFYWKYASWLTTEIQKFYPSFLNGQSIDVTLPVGISFFTLQGMAYVIDYSKGKVPFIRFKDYLLFKSFFPQLVAGPIVRTHQLLPQIQNLVGPDYRSVVHGLFLLLLGFFQKVVVSDRIAFYVDPVFLNPHVQNSLSLFLGMIGYTVQIWADFSGYTNMGRGAASMLGIHLPHNFQSPYLATSPSEFWKRWHISLSEWIRDYIYIPLGGAHGSFFRICIVTLMTMLISGLWHGANWTFVMWGFFHGLLLVVERFIKNYIFPFSTIKHIPEHWKKFLGLLTTQVAVMLGWIIFRSENMEKCYHFIYQMLTRSQGIFIDRMGSWIICLGWIYCLLIHIVFYKDIGKTQKNHNLFHKEYVFGNRINEFFLEISKKHYAVYSMILGGLLAAFFICSLLLQMPGQQNKFIYFQF
jgi:D-alanyl-lipoteichoic acid acyltransferase DltB (MBOAT superfamily)